MKADRIVAVTPINRPPRATQSERALLGCLLLDARAAWPGVADVVEAKHFGHSGHRLIFAAMAELMAESIIPDGVTVADRLAADGQLDAAGGSDYLEELIEGSPSPVNAESYALQVRDAAERERLIEVLNQGIAKAREGSADDAAEFLRSAAGFLETIGTGKARPLPVSPVASWAERDPPPPRDWVMEGFIPAARVTSLLGNGGLGKTLIAMQIGLHVSLGRPLWGTDISGGPVLGVFCEDEQDELERRGRAACAGESVELDDVDRFFPFSRDGQNNLLCTFERDEIKLTSFYYELDATIAEIRPRLVILDTAADLFAGDFMSTPHVRQFIKVALGGLCTRYGCAVLLLAHPSTSAMNSGDGGGFSTAWNNSVRSRLYLRRPKASDGTDVADRRVLEVRKANYGPDGSAVPLAYESGYFVLDPDPVDENAAAEGRGKPAATRLTFVIHEFMRTHSPGLAVPFGQILDHAVACGAVPRDASSAAARKQVQRALNQLCTAEVVRKCQMPRGTYRLLETTDAG